MNGASALNRRHFSEVHFENVRFMMPVFSKSFHKKLEHFCHIFPIKEEDKTKQGTLNEGKGSQYSCPPHYGSMFCIEGK